LPEGGGKNPTRIILDSQLRTPLEANVLQTDEADTIIVTTIDADSELVRLYEEKGVSFIYVSREDSGLNLQEMLLKLFKRGITDVLVEGGGAVNASFLRTGLIDKYLIYIAPKVLGGRNSLTPFTGDDIDSMDAAIDLSFEEIKKFGEDIRITAYPKQGDKK
jgi:diaminohydroxyphosphoribosylaminopyrimidine deaminase/5-amino-6-(5-phosphoribosylamino)uracil reductase